MKIIYLNHLDYANLKINPKHHMNKGESKVPNHQLALATRGRRRDEVPRPLIHALLQDRCKTPSKVAPDLVPKLHKSLQAKGIEKRQRERRRGYLYPQSKP